jgi:hypothetical protein
MSVHPARGSEHRGFTLTANPPEGFTQRQANFAAVEGGFGHFLERRPQRQR